MILHIVDDEKFVDDAFFYSQRINSIVKHKFIVINSSKKLKHIVKTPVEILSKFEIYNPYFIQRLIKYDAVILHRLDYTKLMLVLLSPRKVNFTWIGLGGDYYRLLFNKTEDLFLPETIKAKKNDTRSGLRLFLKKKFYNGFIGRNAIKKINNFAPVLDTEFQLFKKTNTWYDGKFADFNYGTGILKIKKLLKEEVSRGPNILLGNSATYENNHLDLFNEIKEFNLEGKKIICPLSYGREEYKERVINAGKEIFMDKFEGLTEFLTYEKYVEKLTSCSIVLMNHKRQQALGNIMLMLALGAKVYLRNENAAFSFFKKMGITIFSIQDITVESDFYRPLSLEEVRRNKSIIKNRYEDEIFIKKISRFYKNIA